MSGDMTNATRVLYVEDEKDVQYAISQMLKILGYEVTCADNGKIGVEKAEEWKPDIILMDVRMPVMDGVEAIRILRSKPDTKKIPILVLSAYTDARTREACQEAGADTFIAKPVDIQTVDAAIKKSLGLSTS